MPDKRVSADDLAESLEALMQKIIENEILMTALLEALNRWDPLLTRKIFLILAEEPLKSDFKFKDRYESGHKKLLHRFRSTYFPEDSG